MPHVQTDKKEESGSTPPSEKKARLSDTEAQISQHCDQLIELKINRFEIQQCQTSALFHLPEEILLLIFESLSIPDTITMATTCKMMAQFISRNFVFKVVLPLSSVNQTKFNGRNVLSIISAFDMSVPLGHWNLDKYLKTIEGVGLEQLQKLMFSAFELSDHNYLDLIVPPLYHEILGHYLSKSKRLKELHIEIDNSKEMLQMMDIVAKTLPCLRKVVLHACYYPSDEDLDTQERVNSPELDFVASLNLNELLQRLFKSMSIRSLRIYGLGRSLRFNNIRYPLEIYSPSLHFLRIDQAKFFFFKDLKCPELREFNHRELYRKSKCLFHEQTFAGKINYATLLAEMSPKLEKVNGFDVKHMRSCMVDPKSIQEWLSLLRNTCDCDFCPRKSIQFKL